MGSNGADALYRKFLHLPESLALVDCLHLQSTDSNDDEQECEQAYSSQQSDSEEDEIN